MGSLTPSQQLRTRPRHRWRDGLNVTAALLGAALIAGGCETSTQSSSHSTSAVTGAVSIETSTSSARQANAGAQLRLLPRGPAATGTARLPAPTPNTVDRAFLEAVFNNAQRFWSHEFRAAELDYSPAKLVIFSSNVESACGVHEDAGPFYCPGDDGIYLDVRWFEALARLHRVGAFAQAYIVGHEFGHHVQSLLGIDVGAAGERNPSRRNALSVAGELQADCLAGVWAHSVYTRDQLTAGDLQDMLRKAEVIGDDFGARARGQPVDPGLFTHGSSAQRQYWLSTGFESGDPNACDTFSGG